LRIYGHWKKLTSVRKTGFSDLRGNFIEATKKVPSQLLPLELSNLLKKNAISGCKESEKKILKAPLEKY
jgi:hypothetical protein